MNGHYIDEARVRVRVDDLLGRMTLEEKAGQLIQFFYLGPVPEGLDISTLPPTAQEHVAQIARVEEAVRSGQAGSILFVTDPATANRMQRLAVEESRLGIPLLLGFDVVHGLRTIMPVPIGLAATWDPDTVQAAQASLPASPEPSASIGRSHPWSTSPGTPDGDASSRVPVRTRSSAQPSPPPR